VWRGSISDLRPFGALKNNFYISIFFDAADCVPLFLAIELLHLTRSPFIESDPVIGRLLPSEEMISNAKPSGTKHIF